MNTMTDRVSAICAAQALAKRHTFALSAALLAFRISRTRTPKMCGCGRSHDLAAWLALPHVGLGGDDVSRYELRNCPCGSTIAVAFFDKEATGPLCPHTGNPFAGCEYAGCIADDIAYGLEIG